MGIKALELLPTQTQRFALSYTDDTPVLNADGSPAQGVDPNDAADQFMRSNLHDWRTYILKNFSVDIYQSPPL